MFIFVPRKTTTKKTKSIMKQINNIKSGVFLSRYDNSDALLPVSEKYKSMKNVCVAVKFGDTVVKISPANTCKCTWDEAVKNHKDKLVNPAFWQMVGSVHCEVNQALEMLGQVLLRWIWTDTEDNNPHSSDNHAWAYYGARGYLYAYSKYYTLSVRATKVFQF